MYSNKKAKSHSSDNNQHLYFILNAHVDVYTILERLTHSETVSPWPLCLLPTSVRLLVLPCTHQCRWSLPLPLPLFLSYPAQRNWWRCLWQACATDCLYSLVPITAGGPPPLILSPLFFPVPVTGMRYSSWLWKCTLNTLTLTSLLNEWMNKWTNEWMNEQMNEWMNV